MGRIIAIDYGLKRTGLAVTDELKLIATSLQTVATPVLIDFLENYMASHKVDAIIIGEPKRLNNTPTHTTKAVYSLAEKLKKHFPEVEIKLTDERFTSKIAKHEIAGMGLKKKQRQEKGLTDAVSAVLLLQGYLDSIK
jgi:putative Holliday junction resolvase